MSADTSVLDASADVSEDLVVEVGEGQPTISDKYRVQDIIEDEIPPAVREIMHSRAQSKCIPMGDSIRLMDELFASLDRDGNGLISIEHFDAYCKHSCRDYRVDSMHHLSMLDELLQLVIVEMYLSPSTSGTHVDPVHALYMIFDENCSGQITKAELAAGLMKLGLVPFNYESHSVRRRYAPRSLYCLGAGSRLRRGCVWLANWKWFDRFILVSIFANTAILAIEDYQDIGHYADQHGIAGYTMNTRNSVVQASEIIFNTIYTFETVTKIVAMGFIVDPGSYLRDLWHWLDFIVVVFGLLGSIPGIPKISSIRVFRLLRPLRTLSSLPGMRSLIGALLESLPGILNSLGILMATFFLFAVLGMQFWGSTGVLHNTCRTTPTPVDGVWQAADGGRVCDVSYPYKNETETNDNYHCPFGQTCGSEWEIPAGTTIDAFGIGATATESRWVGGWVGCCARQRPLTHACHGPLTMHSVPSLPSL
jgi:Ca2+-binding EF-hand superfamily protein